MKAITRASRVNSAIQVIQRMNNGMTVIAACPEVGLPRSSFYAIMKDNPEVIAEVQEVIEAESRQQLGLILMNKTEILHKVIADALSDSTKPKERLAIIKFSVRHLMNLGHHHWYLAGSLDAERQGDELLVQLHAQSLAF